MTKRTKGLRIKAALAPFALGAPSRMSTVLASVAIWHLASDKPDARIPNACVLAYPLGMGGDTVRVDGCVGRNDCLHIRVSPKHYNEEEIRCSRNDHGTLTGCVRKYTRIHNGGSDVVCE